MTGLATIDLGPRLEEYLRIRRSLGFKLERHAKLLAQFISYLHDQGTDTITIDHVVSWVGLPAGERGWLAFRMSVLRGFLGYLHTLDPAVPVPPADLFSSGPHRAVPYLYSEDELAAPLAATDTLRYPDLRAELVAERDRGVFGVGGAAEHELAAGERVHPVGDPDLVGVAPLADAGEVLRSLLPASHPEQCRARKWTKIH